MTTKEQEQQTTNIKQRQRWGGVTCKLSSRRAGEVSATQNIYCVLRTLIIRKKYWIRACTNYIFYDLALKIMLGVEDWREIKQ
jgi:hypothetical protein